MTNGFIDTGVDYDEVSRLAIVRAEDLNSFASAVVAFANKLPSEANLKEDRVSYCGSTTGTANAQTAVPPYTLTIRDGVKIRAKMSLTNTAAMTLTVAPFGTVAVKDFGGNALVGGETIQNAYVEFVYDLANNFWRIINPLIAVGSVTTFDVNALTTGTDVDALADYVPIYDASAGGLRKVLTGLIADEYQIILKGQLYAGT